MRVVFLRPLLLVAFLLVGCDKSGIHPLGNERDNLGPCTSATSTWLRSTPTGTEIFLIGEAGLDSSGNPTPRCFARGFVEHDSATHFEFGTFAGDATGGTFTYTAEYDFRYQPETPLLQRQGSRRTDHEPGIDIAIATTLDGPELLLTYAGTEHRYRSMLDVIDAVDADTQEGAEDLFRLYNLPLFTSQVRILGFGSSGMTQYLNQTAVFAGTIENYLTVRVEDIFNPKTDIFYIDFMDLTGIAHDGLIHADVGLSGSGKNAGEVAFRMDGNTARIRGVVNYEDLEIERGVAGGGTYTMTVDGAGSYVLSYTFAADIDLRNLLPETTP